MCPAVTGFCSFACTTLYLKYLSYKDTFNFKVFLGKKISVKIFVITHPRLNLLLTHLVPHSVLYPYRKTHVLLICTYLIFISTFHGCLISVCSTLVECLTCSRLLITIYWMNLLNELSKGKYCLLCSCWEGQGQVCEQKLLAMLTLILGVFEYFLLLYVEFHMSNFRLHDFKK